MTYLSHACHELLKSPLTVIFMNKQHFFDCALLEAHLIKLSQQAQELSSLEKEDIVLLLHVKVQ